MKRKLINSQISNMLTIESYRKRMCCIAENVLLIKNLPEFIDVGYVNRTLLKNGAIVFFVDEVKGLIALPYFNISIKDMYGRPIQVEVHGENGQYHRILKNEDGKDPEFVIMYDNQSHISIYSDLLQLSTRIGNMQKIQDVNVLQQKTPRIFSTDEASVKSLKDALDIIDGNESVVVTLSPNLMKDTNVILEPAPFLVDKLHESKQELWDEFLTLVGVASTSFRKKERNITDEVKFSQGGTIANRYSRFESRKRAIELINKYLLPKHNKISGIDQMKDLEVEFYDGLPTTLSPDDGKYEDDVVYDKGGDQNV